MAATLTDHAVKRARERLSWRPETLQRMADRALEAGVRHSEASGKLKRYFDKLFLSHRTAVPVLHGHVIFMLAGQTVVTVLDLPHAMRAAAVKAATRRASLEPLKGPASDPDA